MSQILKGYSFYNTLKLSASGLKKLKVKINTGFKQQGEKLQEQIEKETHLYK